MCKGEQGGSCNKKACQSPGAFYYNHLTEKYYCRKCAMHQLECVRRFGDELAFKEFHSNTVSHAMWAEGRHKGVNALHNVASHYINRISSLIEFKITEDGDKRHIDVTDVPDYKLDEVTGLLTQIAREYPGEVEFTIERLAPA